jgi:antimicrobial peptide system SdpB family protein
MLAKLGEFVSTRLAKSEPWTNVVGVARTTLALATCVTLAFDHPSVLFRPLGGIPSWPICLGPRHVGAFCLVPSDHLSVMRWVCVAILLVVASGWRPRVTGPLHWWVTFSLQANAATVDGGDQVGAILTLLLLPVTLTDDRVWHWQHRESPSWGERAATKHMIAVTALFLIRLQVAGIYWHAAVGKAYAPEWAEGTALYYWLMHPLFGASSWLAPILRPLLLNGVSLSLLTWSIIVLELALCAGLVVAKKHRPMLLVLGIGLHAGIILLHGLVSFGLTMMAALVLFLRPTERRFAWAPRARRREREDVVALPLAVAPGSAA